MRILSRKEGEGGWSVVESIDYQMEMELQGLLAESPSLIPVTEINSDASELVFAVKELGLPGSGDTDLLAFSGNGDIAVVECKLASNAEIKRKVIGQILEYGAYLWGMSYEEVDQRVRRICGSSLAEAINKEVGDPNWDEETFRAGVQRALDSGSFMLVIAVDQMNEELRKTIDFINGCGSPSFSFFALEMDLYRTGSTDVLVPHLHGQPSNVAAETSTSKPIWDEQKFIKVVSKENTAESIELITGIYQWAKRDADQVDFNRAPKGSFSYYYRNKKRPRTSIFTLDVFGAMSLSFGAISNIDPGITQKFYDSLRELPAFQDIVLKFEGYPSVKVAEAFKTTADLECFKKAVTAVGADIHSSTKGLA